MRVCAVLPVYNEADTIEEIVSRVRATGRVAEIVAVDDASDDGTRQKLDRLASEIDELRVFFHETNRGKGAALRTAFAHVESELIVIQDADLEYDPTDYTVLLRPILDGKADVVYGSRFLGGPYVRVHLFWHYVGNRFLTLLSNCFTNLNLTDMETCYKVFRREVAQKLDIQSKSFAVEPEITAKVAKMRVRVYEVPISYSGRDYSEGKKIGPKDAIIALFAIVRWTLFA